MPASLKPTLAGTIDRACKRTARNLAVAQPGIVVSYDESSETATVRPAVHKLVPSRVDPDTDIAEEYPAVPGVPVMWPRGVGFEIKGSLRAGDPVLLVACDWDISAWLRTGRLSAPEDARPHHWQNAVAIPGLVPRSNPFNTPAPPRDAAALASKLDLLIGALKGWPVGSPDGGAALKAYVTTLFPNVPAGPAVPVDIQTEATTGSEILKLEE